MTKEREALKLALEALEYCWSDSYNTNGYKTRELSNNAITAIKEALAQEKALQALHDENERLGLYKDAYAQPEQEPVAWEKCQACGAFASPTPQQRTWVGLDPEEIRKTNHHMVDGAYHYSFKQGAEWAEAKLKEKNA